MAKEGYCKEEIDGYIISYNKQIGRGAFGQVLECRNKKIEGPLCVKVLRCEEKTKIVAERELEILRKVMQADNPNLVKVLHLVQENNIFYFFMRKYPSNLRQWLEKKSEKKEKISLPDIFKIIQQLVNGYKTLYENNIIHRDLKPENILIGDDGLLKIADFGLGKINENLENILKQTLAGTLEFASPQIYIDCNYSSKTDVYSVQIMIFQLGVLTYVITYGKNFINPQTQLQYVNQLQKLLQYQQLKLPIIENPGDPSLASDLVDFLKNTITYDETDRLGWLELFDQFNEREITDQYKFQISQQFFQEKQQFVEEATQSKQNYSAYNQQYNQSQEKLRTSFKPIIKEFDPNDITHNNNQISSHKLSNSSPFIQQNETVRSDNKLNFRNVQHSESSQQIKRQCIGSFNILPTENQRENCTIFESNIKKDFESTNKDCNISSSGKIKIKEVSDYSHHVIEQLPEISSQSIVCFQSQIQDYQPSLISFRENRTKLKKKNQNYVSNFIELILAKVRIADETQKCLINYSQTLPKENYISQELQLLLIAYKYSLYLNGYLIAFDDNMKEKTKLWKQLKNQFTLKNLQEYIYSPDLEIQMQRQQLLQLHEQSRLDLENFLSQFFSKRNPQVDEFQGQIHSLFIDQSSYWKHEHFSQLYGGIFETLFKQSTFNSNDRNLIKFLAYSLKYIRLEKEYPWNNFFQIDFESLYLCEDHQTLLDNIKENANYIRFR